MAVTEFKRTYFGTVLGYVWSLMRPLLLFASCSSSSRRSSGSAATSRTIRCCCSSTSCSSASSRSRRRRGHLGRRPGGHRPQDPVPAPGDPALDRPHRADEPRAQLDRRLRLHPRLRRRPDVDLAAVSGASCCRWSCSRPRSRCCSRRSTCASATASSGPCSRRCSSTARRSSTRLTSLDQFPAKSSAQPADPDLRAAREWIIDPAAPSPVDSAGGVAHLVGSLVVFVAVCVVSIWVFAREAPRMAEEL